MSPVPPMTTIFMMFPCRWWRASAHDDVGIECRELLERDLGDLPGVELGEDDLALVGERADDRPGALVDRRNHAPGVEVLVGQLVDDTLSCRRELVAGCDHRNRNDDGLLGHGSSWCSRSMSTRSHARLGA